jgi:tripeptide aminopeptidase
VNFGTIHGGNGINIVPERVRIEGEIRGISHEQVLSAARQIRETFERAAAKEGGRVSVQMIENIRGYSIPKNSRVVRRFTEAVKAVEGLPEPKLITTFGGSDANRLNENGIETIVIANAMKNCHSTEEYISKEGLIKTAQLTLKLMTACFQGQ